MNLQMAIAAHRFVESLKADGFNCNNCPYWYGWAVREAFQAGARYERAQARAAKNGQKAGKQKAAV